MTTTIKRGVGLIALLTAIFFLAAGVRSAESQNPAPAAASQAESATHPSQQQPAQAMEPAPCQGMMGRMGMAQMGKGPGMMPGMGGMMGMPGMGMKGMGMRGGMGMPGMEMGGMGMMPMMHGHMMMRMMARNPKLAGKMMQMRADMMRAMADVLTKYGKQMESGQWPAAPGKGDEGD